MMVRVGVLAQMPVVREGLAAMVSRSRVGFEAVTLSEMPSDADGFDAVVVDEALLAPRPADALRALSDGYRATRFVPLLRAVDGQRMRFAHESRWGVLCVEDDADCFVRGLEQVVAGAPHIPDRLARFMAHHLASTTFGGASRVGVTQRELEVMRLAANGLTVAEIAASLFMSTSTTKTHLRHVYEKLGVGNRAGAVAQLIALGLISAGSLS